MSSESESSGKRRRENSRSGESLPKLISSSDDPLCCCEYINDKGERSHLLGFCCDCETLDDSFERLFQGQPQPKGRLTELCAVFSDRFRFPWLHGARRVELEVVLPALIIPTVLWLGICSPIWTVVSFLLIPIWIHIIRKCMLIKKRGTKFYCSFTLTSFVLSYLIFEFKLNNFEGISGFEHFAYILLLCTTLGLMFYTRVRGREDRRLTALSDKLPSYYFCRTCQFYVDGRDHHCVWLHCCIGHANKLWFVTALVIGCCWITFTICLTLKIVCDPVEFFSGLIVLHLSCPAVYQDHDTAVCFVTAVYGMIVLVLLVVIIIHQSRLLWRGVSYLDWKYGKLLMSGEMKAKPEVAIT